MNDHTMPSPDYLGSPHPKLVLYLPHRPNGLEPLLEHPSAGALVAANSNHWRKIVTLLAKIASPHADDWRRFRDESLFQQTALCFAPKLVKGTPIDASSWHWIGGRENLQRFTSLHHQAEPLTNGADVFLDRGKRLLLTPYPDYRQLSNRLVSDIRSALSDCGFYPEPKG